MRGYPGGLSTRQSGQESHRSVEQLGGLFLAVPHTGSFDPCGHAHGLARMRLTSKRTGGEKIMAGQFEGTVEIDRPVEEVFAFLADGENDPKFSPRVREIAKTTEGPTAVGTVYQSTVKDAGLTTQREFKITEFKPSSKIRWTEISKNMVTAKEGGYDLESTADGKTKLRVFNVLEGHGFGKLIAGLALSAARKDADAFAHRIKAAVEAA
jgi:carbon monoxide dehydrogenase subunit G